MTDIKNKVTVKLTKDKYDNSFPTFSSDDKKVVYLSRRRDTNKDGKIDTLDFCNICIMDISNKKVKVIVSDEFYNKFPTFANNSESVVFLTSGTGKERVKNKEIRDIFENKSIYIADINNNKIEVLVSNRYFSSSFPQVSNTNKLAYLSWRKNTRRGIFIRDIYKLPSIFELKEIIEENL